MCEDNHSLDFLDKPVCSCSGASDQFHVIYTRLGPTDPERWGDSVCPELKPESGQRSSQPSTLTCVTWLEMQNIWLPGKDVRVIGLVVFVLITVSQIHNVVS